MPGLPGFRRYSRPGTSHNSLVSLGDLFNELPEELTMTILAWLPLKDLARYRSVCKEWHEMWHSRAFLQIRRSCVPVEPPWFIFNRSLHSKRLLGISQNDLSHSPSFCYNPWINEWHTCKHLPVPIDRVTATADGLMFCVKIEEKQRPEAGYFSEMIVCNPLRSNCHTQLPRRPNNWRPHTIGMVVDSRSNTFKIVLGTLHNGTEIYDSKKKNWKLLGHCFPPPGCAAEAISHQGNIFSVGEHGLCTFDVEKEVWRSLGWPTKSQETMWKPQIYDCEGRLILVASWSQESVIRTFVWELVGGIISGSSVQWRELSSASTAEIRKTFRLDDVIENGRAWDLLLLRGPIQKERLFLTAPSWKHPFLYSLSRKTWYLVDIDENPVHLQQLMYQGEGLRFEPKIEASCD